MSYQTNDLASAMAADAGSAIEMLRVDGGMVANDWLLQFLADILEIPVERPTVTETTALGAAQLAALGAGEIGSIEELAGRWRLDRRFRASDGRIEAGGAAGRVAAGDRERARRRRCGRLVAREALRAVDGAASSLGAIRGRDPTGGDA